MQQFLIAGVARTKTKSVELINSVTEKQPLNELRKSLLRTLIADEIMALFYFHNIYKN
jgi:hypothetical protein